MSKTVLTVFGIIGAAVLALVVWQLVFNDGGIIKTAWNAVAGAVNTQWQKVGGKDSTLLPTWGTTSGTYNGSTGTTGNVMLD